MPAPQVEAWLSAQDGAMCFPHAIPAERRAAGRPISQFESQIAAVVRANGAAVATRNVGHFDGCRVEVIDPWRG